MSRATHLETVFTEAQREHLLAGAVRVREADNFESELSRRRGVGEEFRQLVRGSGLIDGQILTRDQLAEMVRLEWKIQNLNAMSLTRLLGTYPYYQHFKDFRGDPEAFVAHMREQRPTWEASSGHPGADLEVLSNRLRAVLSSSGDEFAAGLDALMEIHGVGRAYATGALMLLDPKAHALINNPTVSIFREDGPLKLERGQQLVANERAAEKYPRLSSLSRTGQKVLTWTEVLFEVRALCEFEDFHEVDLLVWSFVESAKSEGRSKRKKASREPMDAQAAFEVIEAQLAEIEPQRIEVRREAEQRAHRLIQERLGRLGEEDVRELYGCFNADYHQGKARRDRFAPAFAGAHLRDAIRSLDALNRSIERIWTAPDGELEAVLDEFWQAREIPNAGRGLPSMVLHVRDPEKYHVLVTATGKGYRRLTGKDGTKRTGAFYRAFCKRVNKMREDLGVPPEAADIVLWRLGQPAESAASPAEEPEAERGAFTGFTGDTFRFLGELKANNTSAWFDENRERFVSQVRRPMRQLVTDLGTRFFSLYTTDIEYTPKVPQTLARIRKNVYGRMEENAYWDFYWAAFHRKSHKKTSDFQLYVAVHSNSFHCGMYLQSAPPEDIERLRERLTANPEKVQLHLDAARDRGLQFVDADGENLLEIGTAHELAAALAEGSVTIRRAIPASDPQAVSADLVSLVEQDYSVLYPLYLVATSEQPYEDIEAFLSSYGSGDEPDVVEPEECYTLEQLLEETLLGRGEVDTLVELLADKPQLIFYGAPGTGKTWLAERFARYLIGATGEIKTVQFHPSYGYEDFVEGIRPKLDEAAKQVTYQVVPGIFRRFCDEARKRPKQKFVLIIDEINRGNLPRIFGELLYLLERRGETIDLPVSGKSFSVPPNLIILGTMNTADHSIALLDMALRRRFHFERLDPKPDRLEEWLTENCPDMTYVGELLRRLNDELEKAGIDRDRHIGHSHFMHPDLDEVRLKRIWDHSVLPTLEEFFYGNADRVDAFSFTDFVEPSMGVAASADSEEDDGEDDDAD